MKCLDDIEVTRQELKELDIEKNKNIDNVQSQKKEEKKDKSMAELIKALEEL